MAMLVMSDGDDGDSDGDGCDWEDGVKMMLMRMMAVTGRLEEMMLIAMVMAVIGRME